MRHHTTRRDITGGVGRRYAYRETTDRDTHEKQHNKRKRKHARTHRDMGDEPAVADVGAAPREVGLDVKGAQHLPFFPFLFPLHDDDGAHHKGGVREEVGPEALERQGLLERPGPPLRQFVVQQRPPRGVLAFISCVCVRWLVRMGTREEWVHECMHTTRSRADHPKRPTLHAKVYTDCTISRTIHSYSD